ncbi:hypothetical protein [Streptomyces sp. NPDC005548]|uniref:hypothetical protein n=1 Tax=Streptomyces sp. NPDC005548 TaxID=3364724 RepID=UPI0036B8E297
MRRPAQNRLGPTARTAWAHPYTGILGMAVFYNDGATPPVPPAPGQAPPAADPPKPGPPAGKVFNQDEVAALAAKEKAQGERAGARKALEEFAEANGFTSIDDAKAFIEAGRQAKEAALSEEEKRKAALDKREQDLAAREASTIARERVANRRAVLAGLGATGDDLDDAVALLRSADDADEQQLRDDAASLKTRRPELFGAPATTPATALPPAPGGAPAGGTPTRQAPAGRPGDRGREMARLRGHVKSDA